ncbi:hypothetical protein BDA96_03G279300 [Sorghum bicolor]|uniref:Uncharacterized protein n=1 Tax=Sorghum bicolor TaxID=4558 RepID=A0A921REQ4_SORBI|nr:hypothetical protein BDA96_03G279300 [Sorghum bicolor]
MPGSRGRGLHRRSSRSVARLRARPSWPCAPALSASPASPPAPPRPSSSSRSSPSAPCRPRSRPELLGPRRRHQQPPAEHFLHEDAPRAPFPPPQRRLRRPTPACAPWPPPRGGSAWQEAAPR